METIEGLHISATCSLVVFCILQARSLRIVQTASAGTLDIVKDMLDRERRRYFSGDDGEHDDE